MEKVIAVIAILLQVAPLLIEATSSKAMDPKNVAIIGGRRYYFSEINVNVPEAIVVCQELNMTLTGLETLEEYTAVTDYITTNLGSNDTFWTSGSQHFTTFMWGNIGQPFSFFMWDVGHPTQLPKGAQYDIEITNGLMRTTPPHIDARFICEEKLSCN